MFTYCPNCYRQFRIYAEQIAAASGQVRCGFCHTQFNALTQLNDKPLPTGQLKATVEEEVQEFVSVTEEPEFIIPADDPVTDEPENETFIDRATAAEEIELQRSIAEIGVPDKPDTESAGNLIDEETDSHLDQEDQEQTMETETPEQEEAIPEPEKPRYEFEDDDVLLEESKPGVSRVMTFFWTVLVLSGLILVVGQLAWFNRDRLLLEYPQLRPYFVQACERFNCSVIRERDVAAITLVNRDVRLHPDYQDTLLVNASMQNELPTRQPYPVVQLTLYNTAGAMIGHREFNPTDYLDSSIDIDQGMPVDAPVHFVLEVAGPSQEAVSFEFRFL